MSQSIYITIYLRDKFNLKQFQSDMKKARRLFQSDMKEARRLFRIVWSIEERV